MSMPRELRFAGEVALVTGAGRGIGRGHALELARRGARIVVNDADGPVAQAVADEISAAGGQAVASHDSVATPAGGAAVVDQALDAFGQLDIVVALLSPDAIAPVVAFLAHRDCTLSGQILSAGGGHVSAVRVSVTRGITDAKLSAETVRDRLDEILDPEKSFVPRHIGDDLKQLFAAIEAGPA